jgi:thioredoxin reductase (NADPH)
MFAKKVTIFFIQCLMFLPLRAGICPNQGIENMTIIGSGIAGLTAALYGANEGWSPLVIAGDCGGMLMNAGPLENWPGQTGLTGDVLMSGLLEKVVVHGARLIEESVVKVDFSQNPLRLWTSGGKEIKTHTVVIATGSLPKKLGCPGEKEYWGKGIAVCALCDGPLYKNLPVVVVGGGDIAMGRALFLTQYTNDITIIHRGDALTASPYWLHKVKQNPGIKIKLNTVVKKIVGNGSTVSGVDLYNTKMGKPEHLQISGLFIAIGFKPTTTMFKGQIEIDENECVAVKKGFTSTSVPGVFVAGNIAGHGYKPAIAAAGTGYMAAEDAETYLSELFNKESLSFHGYCPKHLRVPKAKDY